MYMTKLKLVVARSLSSKCQNYKTLFSIVKLQKCIFLSTFRSHCYCSYCSISVPTPRLSHSDAGLTRRIITQVCPWARHFWCHHNHSTQVQYIVHVVYNMTLDCRDNHTNYNVSPQDSTSWALDIFSTRWVCHFQCATRARCIGLPFIDFGYRCKKF
jgi:hypothetical protein